MSSPRPDVAVGHVVVATENNRVRKPGGRRQRPRVPPDARKRVKLACESCRRIKVKCNGQEPCSHCFGTKKVCRYVEMSPSLTALAEASALPTGGDRRRLELLERIFSRLHPGIPIDVDGLQGYHSKLPLENHDSREADKQVRQQNDENLVLGNSPIPPAFMTVLNQGKTHFEGKFSYWTFFHSVRQAVTDDTDAGEASRNEGDLDDSAHPFFGGSSMTDWKTGILAALPPREAVDFLVTTFFRSAQANHFYIHPEIFSRKLHAFYSGTHEFDMQGSANSRRSAEFISVLFMVFAIGSQFAELETDTTDGRGAASGPPLDPRTLDLTRLVVPEPSPTPGWRFYQVSRRLLADVVCSSSMTSIQVCVLQGIFLPSTKSRDAGYNLLGLALRMAVNMGLHRTCGTASLHPHVRELRNRLWWSVYVAERLFSVEMGRPLSISDAEIDAPFPVQIPSWDFGYGYGQHQQQYPHQATTKVENLIAMARLCRLLGKIVEAVYCRPAEDTADEATIIRPRVFRQLKRELDQSRSELPIQLRLSSTTPLSRSVAHIALTYEQATILLTRSCLHHAAVATTSRTGGLQDEAMKFLRQQSQDCLKAAVSSIQILASLRARSLLCRFSFHDTLYCTAALYVLLMGEKLDWLVSGNNTTSSSCSIPTIIPQGILIMLDLAKGSESAASSLRYILRALQACRKDTSPWSAGHGNGGTGNGDEWNNGDGKDDQEARHERGRRAWKAWLSQSNVLPQGSTQKRELGPIGQAGGTGTVHHFGTGSRAADTSRDMNTALGRQLIDTGAIQSQPGTNGHSNTLHSHTIDFGFSTDGSEWTADLSDLQPFWVHDNSDLNLLSRDLSGVPDFPTFDESEFL